MQKRVLAAGFAMFLGSVAHAAAQQAVQAPTPAFPISGTLLDATGQPQTAQTVVTISIYSEQTGGTPLWQERQQVAPDARGRFTLVLGSATAAGIPAASFAGAEARWLGVQADGFVEQPRSLLTSVPYALRSGDANTLGGLPPSAFLLSGQSSTTTVTGTGSGVKDGGTKSGSAAFAGTGTGVEDQVIPDDLIVQGSACIGIDCVNNESFGFDTIRLKENNTRLKFDDTSTSTGFPNNDWQLTANDSSSGGRNMFAIDDITGGKTPFLVMAGAPTNSFFMDSTGRLGLRTATPVLDLHLNNSNTPAIRLEQNNTGGFTAQTWDIGGNEANFFVRDVTGGSKLPFRIRPGAPTSSIDISASGRVGIANASPTARLDVSGFIRSTALSGAPSSGAGTEILYNSGSGGIGSVQAYDRSASAYRTLYLDGSTLILNVGSGGMVGIGTAAPTQPLQMASGAYVSAGGAWTNASSRTLKDHIKDLPADQAWAAFSQLKPVTFNYKANGESHVGFIAEDVPDLVATADRKSLSAMDIVALLTKVTQEQQATIADLQARLARLEAQVAAQSAGAGK